MAGKVQYWQEKKYALFFLCLGTLYSAINIAMQSMFYPSTAEIRELRKIISIVLKHSILTGDFESSNEKYIIRFRNKTVGRDLQLRSLVFFSSSLFFFFLTSGQG